MLNIQNISFEWSDISLDLIVKNASHAQNR